MKRVMQAILFSCLLPVILTINGLAGYACNTSASTPVPASASRMSDGFNFTVDVSNTHPKPGEKVIINIKLENVSNTNVILDDMGGLTPGMVLGGVTTMQITNEAGQVVWSASQVRSGTALTTPVAGWSFGGPGTWTVTRGTKGASSAVPAGTYTLSVWDSGIYDPVLNTQVPFSVTPIQIVVMS